MATPENIKKMKQVRFTDIPEVYDYEVEGYEISAIAKLASPFIKNVLPKVLGTLGLAAATRAVSGAIRKATSDESIEIDEDDLAKLVTTGNMLGKAEMVKPGFCF